MEKMSLEEYRKRLVEYLIQQLGEAKAEKLMKRWEGDWERYYEENYSVEATGCGMIMNLL